MRKTQNNKMWGSLKPIKLFYSNRMPIKFNTKISLSFQKWLIHDLSAYLTLGILIILYSFWSNQQLHPWQKSGHNDSMLQHCGLEVLVLLKLLNSCVNNQKSHINRQLPTQFLTSSYLQNPEAKIWQLIFCKLILPRVKK